MHEIRIRFLSSRSSVVSVSSLIRMSYACLCNLVVGTLQTVGAAPCCYCRIIPNAFPVVQADTVRWLCRPWKMISVYRRVCVQVEETCFTALYLMNFVRTVYCHNNIVCLLKVPQTERSLLNFTCALFSGFKIELANIMVILLTVYFTI